MGRTPDVTDDADIYKIIKANQTKSSKFIVSAIELSLPEISKKDIAATIARLIKGE